MSDQLKANTSSGLFNEKGEELSLTSVFKMLSLKNVTRIEAIDKTGRKYMRWDSEMKVKLDLQDEERTLKVFVLDKDSPAYYR